MSDENLAQTNRRIFFIGFVAPKQLMDDALSQEPAPQISAAKFQLSLLEGLVKNGTVITALSALPTAAFPTSKIKFVRSLEFQMFDKKLRGHLIGGVNLPILKLGVRLAKGWLQSLRVSKRSTYDAILVYSLHTPFLIIALCLKKRTGLPAVVFIPDLPMHMHGRPPKGLHGLLKRADNALMKRLVRGFDLALPFTKGIGEDWLPNGMRFQVVEGIAPPSQRPPVRFRLQNADMPTLLYTGSFTKIAHFAKLFSERPDITAELIFAGDGADRRELEALGAMDARIRVMPFLGEDDLQKLIEKADFLLNPRDSQWEGGRYSFPSKLLDYAYRSKPILSTRLSGIDEKYFEYLLPVDDRDADSLRSSLRFALSFDEDQLAKRVDDTRRYFDQNNSSDAIALSVLEGIGRL